MANSGRVIAIGDVHGCVHALESLIAEIDPAPDDRLVFLGDLIDHGSDTRDTLDLVIDLTERCRVVLIQGNHEEMMYAARENEQAFNYWVNIGGGNTLFSYRAGAGLRDIPEAHWRLLDYCLPYYETADTIFTHAHYLPDAPMSEQPGRQLRWNQFDPDEMQPHMSGKTVVVGHTEQRDGEILDLGFAVCIDTACWRYGWLTALERPFDNIWQASRWGQIREPGEASHREPLTELLKKQRQAPAMVGA